MSKLNIPNNIIALVGLMGSGKSKCGSLLANILNYKFFDIDKIIETEQDLKINEIFKKFGENYFREIEEKTILIKVQQILINKESAILSLGGGAFDSYITRKQLLDNTKVVWLDAPLNTLAKRIGKGENRPMLNNNIMESLKTLRIKRKIFYKNAHLKVLTNDKSLKEICDEVIEGIIWTNKKE